MSLVLLVYSEYAFKEFLLPLMDNTDYELVLRKDIFCISNNLEVKLEVIDNNWRFVRSSTYSLTKEGVDYFEEQIKDQDVLKMTSDNGQTMTMIVRRVKNYFSVYEKFDLIGHNQVTIGKNKENLICFDDLGVISRSHAILVKKGNYYVIEDHSVNGTFVNHIRVQGSKQLAFGDCIDIFGLRIVFLGDRLAVNTSHPHVIVDSKLAQINEGVIVETEDDEQEVEDEKQKVIFHRSPRYISTLDTEPIEIEVPPAPKQVQKQPLAMVVGPSMTMALPMLLGCGLTIYGSSRSGGSSGIFMYTGLVTAVSCALIATIWSLININYAKKKNREEELHRFEAYSEYLIKCTETIKES